MPELKSYTIPGYEAGDPPRADWNRLAVFGLVMGMLYHISGIVIGVAGHGLVYELLLAFAVAHFTNWLMKLVPVGGLGARGWLLLLFILLALIAWGDRLGPLLQSEPTRGFIPATTTGEIV